MSSEKFHIDSRNRVTDRDGLVAIVMKASGSPAGEDLAFRFRSTPYGPPIEVRWGAEDTYQKFPEDIADLMVLKGYATYVPEEMLEEINGDLEPDALPAKRGRKPRKEVQDEKNPDGA